MKTSHTILADLLIGQATTDAIAEHLHQPRPVIAAYLQDLETDGLVVSRFAGIRKCLQVWRITEAGRTVAEQTLQPS